MITNPLKEVSSFISSCQAEGNVKLSKRQFFFVSFCISCIVLLGEFNFSAFSRLSFSNVSSASLSWMIHHSSIGWKNLIDGAIIYLFRIYDITNIHLLIDDSDRPRCKVIKAIYGVFKTIDKKTGGYFLAQNIVFIAVVCNKVTFPIGFKFYRPDPEVKKWEKEDKKLRRKGIKKKNRPSRPSRNKEFPTRIEIAVELAKNTKKIITKLEKSLNIKVKVLSISADSAYLSKEFTKGVKKQFKKTQIISQLASNQIIWNKNQVEKSVKSYFEHKKPTRKEINLRGKAIYVEYISARVFVKSHGKKLLIVAMKYKGEENYRYLAATELTWQTVDVIKAYALRWLIEVVIEDWKQYDGWGKKASQQGVDGACRGVQLSLLTDFFLLSHEYQHNLYLAGQSLATTGSLIRRIRQEHFVDTIQGILERPNPQSMLKKLVSKFDDIFKLDPSCKHMMGIEIGEFGSS